MTHCEFTWHDRECGMPATHTVHWDGELLHLCDEDYRSLKEDSDAAFWVEGDLQEVTCVDPDHGIGDHPCDEVLGPERAAALRDLGDQP